MKNKLTVAINDIDSFYEIEKKLTERLAEKLIGKTAEAIKKETRNELQGRTPSEHSAPAAIRNMRNWLESI